MPVPPQMTALPPRERWIATGSLMLGMVAFTIALMMTNVILPQLMTSLRADLDQVQWVLTGPGIAQTVVMPMVGWLTSLIGHRALYLGSLALFCGTAVLSGLAWSIESLIVFQTVSGLGIGLLQPLIAVLLYQIFPPNQRGLALGLSMVGWSFGPAMGPLVGGYLIEVFNWRAAFYVSVPLGVAGLVCTLLFLPRLPRPARRTMDQYGLLTMTIALTTLLMALTQGRREGWDSSYIVTLLAIGTVAAVLFLLVEWRGPAPLVDLRLFRSAPFALAALVVFISSMAFRGTGIITILFVQQVLERTPLEVGWLLLPGNIAYGVAVMLTGRLADKMSPSLLTVSGLGVFALTFFWFATINETVGMGLLMLLLSLRLTSFGIVGPPNNLTAMRALPEEQVVMASGVFALLRSISGTLGAAVSATLYEQRYFSHVQRYTDNTDLTAPGVQDALPLLRQVLEGAGESPAFLPVQALGLLHQRLLAEATTLAYQDYFLLSAVLGGLAILPALPWAGGWKGVRRRWGGRQTERLPAVEPLPGAQAGVSIDDTPQGNGSGVPRSESAR
jgi:MFS transporter, DHA2 family, multidrug resistance protein